MLASIRSTLFETVTELNEKINDPTTAPDVRAALRTELLEVNHRFQILLGQEIRKEVASLQAKAEKIKEARNELREVLENIQRAIDVIRGVTRFLTAVDRFIDAAKPLFI